MTYKMLNRIMIQFKIKAVQNRGESEMVGRGRLMGRVELVA